MERYISAADSSIHGHMHRGRWRMLRGRCCHGQVLRVEGAFASPIEVQAAQGPGVEPLLTLDPAGAPQVSQSLLHSTPSLCRILLYAAILSSGLRAHKEKMPYAG